MSIAISEMKPGLVVRDPKFTPHAPTRQFFKLEEPESEEGPWPALNCASGARMRFRLADLGRLVPASGRVFCEVDLSALIGRRVRVDLKFGSQGTGYVQEVRTYDFAIEDARNGEVKGEAISVPEALIIGEEEYAIKQISNITVLD